MFIFTLKYMIDVVCINMCTRIQAMCVLVVQRLKCCCCIPLAMSLLALPEVDTEILLSLHVYLQLFKCGLMH